jgi:hypothetical protein
MYYLFEHQLGYHSLALGFPSIDSCHAICLQTKTGLFGLHVYGCDKFNDQFKSMDKEVGAWAKFVTNHPLGSDFVHLYGVSFHDKRAYVDGSKGDKKGKKIVDGWKKELKMYAKAIGYTGKVSSFDLSSVPNWPKGLGSSDSAYVEFRRVFDDVTILYKPWSECVPSPESKPVSDGVNYRSTTHKGEVSDTFWFKKSITSLGTAGSGFVVSPGSLRTTFKHK